MVHLENNAFTGTLPTELSDLRNAFETLFSGNNLTGSVHDVLCASDKSWKNLQSDCILVAPTNDHGEIECDCCTSCCNVNREDCEAM